MRNFFIKMFQFGGGPEITLFSIWHIMYIVLIPGLAISTLQPYLILLLMLFKSLQTLFLPFKVPCDFWLKGRQNVLDRKVSKKTFSDVVKRCWGRE